MKILSNPIKTLNFNGKNVGVFVEDSNYSDAFGYEWKMYSRTYTDSTLGTNVSRRRLELNLGFPLEFLKDMTVLELGSGQGRFTEHLADYAKEVVSVDMSEAVYHNVALGRANVTAIRADINSLPEFSEGFDLIFCRGVIQHTKNPQETLKSLFKNVKEGGLVIFDVYKKTSKYTIDFKYFWRPIIQRLMTEERFDQFMKRHTPFLYKAHHVIMHMFNFSRLIKLTIGRLPLCYHFDWNKQYPQVPIEGRYEIFRNEFIDMLYSGYDSPMSTEEVIQCLAEIGQTPYSYDIIRNHFRVKKVIPMESIKVRITKNGIVPVI